MEVVLACSIFDLSSLETDWSKDAKILHVSLRFDEKPFNLLSLRRNTCVSTALLPHGSHIFPTFPVAVVYAIGCCG